MPIAFDAFNEIWLVCLFHDRIDSMRFPKKLNYVTRSMLLPFICSSGYITDFATFSDNLLAPNYCLIFMSSLLIVSAVICIFFNVYFFSFQTLQKITMTKICIMTHCRRVSVSYLFVSL